MHSDIRILEDAELDAVGGGSAWYDVFHAIGEFIGRGERGYIDQIDRNGGVAWLA